MKPLPRRYSGFRATAIPDRAEMARTVIHPMPLVPDAPSTPAAESYRAPWSEVLDALRDGLGATDSSRDDAPLSRLPRPVPPLSR